MRVELLAKITSHRCCVVEAGFALRYSSSRACIHNRYSLQLPHLVMRKESEDHKYSAWTRARTRCEGKLDEEMRLVGQGRAVEQRVSTVGSQMFFGEKRVYQWKKTNFVT